MGHEIPWFRGRSETVQVALEKGRRQLARLGALGVGSGRLLGEYRDENKQGQALDDKITGLDEQLRRIDPTTGMDFTQQVQGADEQTDTPETRGMGLQGKEREDVPPSSESQDGPQSSRSSYVKPGGLGSREMGGSGTSKVAEMLRVLGGPFFGTQTHERRDKRGLAARMEGAVTARGDERKLLGALSNTIYDSPDRTKVVSQIAPRTFGGSPAGSFGGKTGDSEKASWEIIALRAAHGDPDAQRAWAMHIAEKTRTAGARGAGEHMPAASVQLLNRARELAIEEWHQHHPETPVVDQMKIDDRAREIVRNLGAQGGQGLGALLGPMLAPKVKGATTPPGKPLVDYDHPPQ